MAEYCDRCRRAAPSEESDDYVYWEAAVYPERDLCVLICPGCVTGEEQQAADEDEMDTLTLIALDPDLDAERARP